jgi:uncharacterized protein YlbG (UPF0298 family)
MCEKIWWVVRRDISLWYHSQRQKQNTMNAQLKCQKEAVEAHLSKIAGVQVTITVRRSNSTSLTYSFEGKNEDAELRIKQYFAGHGVFTDGGGNAGYCHIADLTCLFHEL